MYFRARTFTTSKRRLPSCRAKLRAPRESTGSPRAFWTVWKVPRALSASRPPSDMLASPSRKPRIFCVLATTRSSSFVRGGAKRLPKGPSGLSRIAWPMPGRMRRGEAAASCFATAFRPLRPRQSMPRTVSSIRNSRKKSPSSESRKVIASRELSASVLPAVAAAQEVGRSPTLSVFICWRRSIVSVRSLSWMRPAWPALLASIFAKTASCSTLEGIFSLTRKASRARRRSISRSASKMPSLP
mmetsp:Transcript_46713/g.137974  ORF Transcript_46713/g.137974 Transcript_46713/m.137974 type:complete len:243 (+) Transcript_46713:249-977(+)